MKTFTVRDLDREPGAVLDACDQDGAVQVRRRDGRTYKIAPDERPTKMGNLPDFEGRIRKIFGEQQLTREQTDAVDRLIAGE